MSFLNETGLATLKTWIVNTFAGKTEFNTLETRVEGLVTAGGEPNTIESVSVNGTTVSPDAQKNVAITVPTATSDLTNDGDGTSNFATEAYVQTNGGKIDKITVNGTEQAISNKTVALTVPVKVSELQNDGDGTTGSQFATKNYVDTEAGTIRSIDVNGAAVAPDANKNVSITVPTALSDLTNDADFLTEAEIDGKIATAVTSVYKYKSSVATTDALPTSGMEAGDVYDVQANGMNYAWNGTAWDPLGQLVDVSALWGKSELEAMTVDEVNTILNA